MNEAPITRTPAPPADPQRACLICLIDAALALRQAKQIAEGLKPIELEKIYWQTSDALTIVVQAMDQLEPLEEVIAAFRAKVQAMP
jgi:hypothetical protein